MLGLVARASGHAAITVPTGTLLDLKGKILNGERLMEAFFDGQMVMMLTADLRSQAILL
jgi:hypothetical protein